MWFNKKYLHNSSQKLFVPARGTDSIPSLFRRTLPSTCRSWGFELTIASESFVQKHSPHYATNVIYLKSCDLPNLMKASKAEIIPILDQLADI